MARRLTIIAAGAVGVALFAAFLVVGDPEVPEPAPTADEPARATRPARGKVEARTLPGKPMTSADASVEKQPATDTRWAECAAAIPDELPPALDGLGEGRTPPIVATLSDSGSAEHVLAGALLRPQNDAEAILADIERALSLDGDHPLVLWHADDLCGKGVNAPHCRRSEFSARVSESLDSNGALWIRRAVRNLERGNEREALDNVRRAAVAPEYENYWSQHIVMFDRALAIGGDLSNVQRTMTAVGVASAVDGPGYRIFQACRERSANDSLWMDACTLLATRVSADSRTFLDKALSYGLLEDLYEQSGRDDAARIAAGKGVELKELLHGSAHLTQWLSLDDRVSARWLDELVANGEIAAMRFVSAEFERLKADPDYDPCALTLR